MKTMQVILQEIAAWAKGIEDVHKALIAEYRAKTAADRYFFGFPFKGDYYIVDCKEIPNNCFYTSKKDNKEYIRIRIKNNSAFYLINFETVIYNMPIEKHMNNFNKWHETYMPDKDYNMGDYIEYMVYKLHGQKWVNHGNAAYYEKGDINVDGIEYQIKSDTATMTASLFIQL